MRLDATRFVLLLSMVLLAVGSAAYAAGDETHEQSAAGEAVPVATAPNEGAAEESWVSSILGLIGMGAPEPVAPITPEAQAKPEEPTPAKEHAGGGELDEKGGSDAEQEKAHEPAEGGGWFSSLLGLVGLGGGDAQIEGETHGSGETAKDEAGKTADSGPAEGEHKPSDGDGHGGPKQDEKEHAQEQGEGEHKEAAPKQGGGWLSSLLGLVGLGGGSAPAEGEAADGSAAADAHGAADKHGEAGKAEAGAAEDAAHGGESGAGDHGEGAAHAEGEEPPPPPLWPEKPAVEHDRQPYVLVRGLRSVQDKVAQGNKEAFELQRTSMRDIGEQMRRLPTQVWDDTRNVRAAVYYVLTGGDPRVLTMVAGHKTPIYVPRRLIRGALAYGEGRLTDALKLLGPINTRELDPLLGGAVAFIQGTLHTKKEPKKAIERFDEARLLAPGTLIEESALRQAMLLLARDGELERFDQLASQYSRRFGRSLFARNFRRQFFAGVARQDFKGDNAWIPRMESELDKVSLGERASLYLSIAEEATKGGHIEIARFAGKKAAELYRVGTRERLRADLYQGAALVATDEVESGVSLLSAINPDQLRPVDRELYSAAMGVGGEVLRPPAEPQDISEPLPEAVTRAQEIMSSVDAMFSGGTQ